MSYPSPWSEKRREHMQAQIDKIEARAKAKKNPPKRRGRPPGSKNKPKAEQSS